jgi:tRNA threonylcarbamoyladenosine biosynthesis protein TsaB
MPVPRKKKIPMHLNYILGIETATKVLSVAIVAETQTMVEYTLNSGQNHEPHLMPMVERVLAESHLEPDRISAIAVSTGPGSFTGVRIGLAAAKGLALALKKPLVGIPTLDGLSYNAASASSPVTICPIIDAKKGEVYAAFYKQKDGKPGMEKLTGYMVLPLEEILKQVSGTTVFVGDILPLRKKIKEELGDRAFFAPPEHNLAKASSIAFLGQAKIARGEETGIYELTPLYVRRAEAEEKWEEQLGITFSEMLEKDIPQVMAIEKESFPTPWAEETFRHKEKAHFITARCGGRILGYAGGWFLYDEFHLGNMAVHKDFRGRGIAKKLLQKILDIAHSKNARSVTLEVRAGNIPAQNLYRKSGFRITGRRKKYYQDTKEDAIIMTRPCHSERSEESL